ncbi:septum formation initiator family protein [Candidatus Gottesmanbacteria bacterium]|nr:septum formation initiator family protein [Candidatus Gottesmanbacteria bacterium]
MNRKQAARLAAIILALYLIITTIRSIFDLFKAGDKLTAREKRVEVLQKEQEDLLRQKAIVNNPNFLEKVARDQLGLSKPGEEMIIIPADLLKDTTPVILPDLTPNWRKWQLLILN